MADKTLNVEFGKVYEDHRTHRSGKVLEYDEKYKTFLLESSDGNTFNVTSSQFKINWILSDTPDVDTTTDKIEKEAPKKADKGLKEDFVQLILVASNFADSFKSEYVTIKPDARKSKFKLFVGKRVVFDCDLRLSTNSCRVWLDDYSNNAVSWTNKPTATKFYPNITRNYITEFSLENYSDVLNDLSVIVIERLQNYKTKMEENGYEI